MGCWAAPFKTEQAEVIRDAMKAPLSKENSYNILFGRVLGDDTLFDNIEALPADESNDVRTTVMYFLQSWFGDNGDDAELLAGMGFVEPFEAGALAIFKEMLTAWNTDYTYPE